MPHFKILEFPDPKLRKISAVVTHITETDRRFIEALTEFMYKQPGGIGIAAPQVGILKKIAIVDVSRKVPSAKRHVLINPEIIKVEGPRILREGCMSLPHYTANAQRFNKIKIKYNDIKMKEIELSAEGVEAICIQHEIDHLNGLLFLDRVGCLESDVFRRKRYF